MKDQAQSKAEVEGHCDERGTVEYNLALGAKRARAAKDYLSALGVSADRLTTISYGEELPLCHEHNEECWARNRRAHFVVLGEEGGEGAAALANRRAAGQLGDPDTAPG